MRAFNVQQGTAEWLQIRTGRLTASRMGDVMAKRKRGDGELACRRDYRMELVCERLTGRASDHYVSPAMDRGSEMEPFARAAYEVATGADVNQVGFILHPTMDFSGASPDSLVDSDGGLEIKAPNTATHLEWMMAGIVPEEHQPQLLWNMACAERAWWDFLSFDDRLPPGLRIFACRMHRDDKRIAEMEYEAIHFNEEIEIMCNGFKAPKWVPELPVGRMHPYMLPSEEMVSIGDLSIPKDLSDILDRTELVP